MLKSSETTHQWSQDNIWFCTRISLRVILLLWVCGSRLAPKQLSGEQPARGDLRFRRRHRCTTSHSHNEARPIATISYKNVFSSTVVMREAPRGDCGIPQRDSRFWWLRRSDEWVAGWPIGMRFARFYNVRRIVHTYVSVCLSVYLL